MQQAATGPPKYKGPTDVARSLWREGGIRSVYKGSVATLLRGKAYLTHLREQPLAIKL